MLSRRALMGGGLASLLVGHEAYAQCVPLDMSNATDKEIDERIKRRMRDYRIPALSLAVVRDGIVTCASYGAAALIPLVQATPKTGYHIGSVGKQFVATAIMLLVEDGTLQLDDQARGYLRQRPPQTWNGITVRHLLTHTSGLLREPIIGDTTDLASVISKSYDEPLLWCPGFRYRYSNLGYFVLAEIIQYVLAEVIRDRAFPDWSTFIEKRVFKPAALNMTRPTNRTRGLALAKRNGFVSLTRHAALRPSGAFVSTALDLAQWDQVLRTDRVLSKESREQMWTRVSLGNGQSSNYGFGWKLLKGPVRIARHTGNARGGGFRSAMLRCLDENLAVIVLTNSSGAKELGEFALDIAKLCSPAVAAAATHEPNDEDEDMDD